ncbi:dystrotelin [Betta splendens]|uniref:Dystrotelin n=1 Tax=Betta splendens TaxID=158456 RepID=A0A6P7PDK9_BETSP|nr:dystrotelin [Betta splendens]
MEGLDRRHLSVYRAAMKLVSLQKLCHMDAVSVTHILEAVATVTEAKQHQELNLEDMSQTLSRMFDSVAPAAVAAPEEISSLLFRLYDRHQTGQVPAAAFQTALIALSADGLLDKYKALVSVSDSSSGSVSRSELRSLLQDLSQIPAAVQEEGVFGSVEAALSSCFSGVSTATVSDGHVLSWMQSNPRLLLWLPTLHRLSITQSITHNVRCHTCKTFPISGLRYRCVKCVNVHVCQSCFLTSRHTKKHKLHHPVLEFCTQPTWRESLSSVVHSACYALLPRRRTQRNADWRMWSDPEEPQNRGLSHADVSTQVADSAANHSPSSSRNASQQSVSSSSSPQTLETDKEILIQQVDPTALMDEVRNLHRDKWLLEQELQTWKLTVQSEQGLLEDRCSEMEVNMETLRQHHLRLQGLLTQALNKDPDQASVDAETQHQPDNTSHRTGTGSTTPTSDMQEEDDEEQQPTPSPTIQWDKDLHYEESVGEGCLCLPAGREDGLQDDDACLSEEDDAFGMCGPEKLLQETVDRLKAGMETDRWKERQKSESSSELLQAAEQVGGSIHHLVDAVSRSSGRRRFLQRLGDGPAAAEHAVAGPGGEHSR